MTFWPVVTCELATGDDPAWLTLRDQIEHTVALEKSSIELAGVEHSWWKVADPEQVLEQAIGRGDVGDQDPFWAATWRSALGLDRFLASLDLPGKSILELGCGCGQVGTSAAMRGGLVTMTDAVELALKLAQLNSWPWQAMLTYQQLVWGKDHLAAHSFPIILGSDIVYDVSLFQPLESCARYHLTPAGKFYVSEPHRESGKKFWQRMLAAGWQVQLHSVDLQDDLPPIRILECSFPLK